MTPSLAKSNRADAGFRRAAQLATLRQGLPGDGSVRPRASQQAFVKRKWRVAGIEVPYMLMKLEIFNPILYFT
jgi:hypothetical protein